MSYLFTSESVSEGHPDKVADQISDAILDQLLSRDPQAKVAVETLVTTGLVVLSGEISTDIYIDLQKTARQVIKDIGYTDPDYMFEANSCGIISSIHEQAQDISKGVSRSDGEIGAGDQGIMFGYACSETADSNDYMPLTLTLAHMLMQELAGLRKEGNKMPYLRPDAKSQVTIEYSDQHKPLRVDKIVVSTQHDPFPRLTPEGALQQIKNDIQKRLIPRVVNRLPDSLKKLFDTSYEVLVNPTGQFILGGPHADTGLTGRKNIVDTYGGRGAHGGGALSGKDATKVDRSGTYAARHIAKNIVAAGIADEVLVQIAYAIGVPEPVGFYVNTHGTAKVNMTDSQISKKISQIFDLRPAILIKRFGLDKPIYRKTAAYGHMGRDPYKGEVTLFDGNGDKKGHAVKADFFAWEKLDYKEKLKKFFELR